MRILLSGASGFIGKKFIQSAPSDWHISGIYRSNADFESFSGHFPNLAICRCNLSDTKEAKEKLSGLPDYFDIGLFVWGNSDINYSCREPLSDLAFNTSSLINLISNIRFGKFIFMSSGTVYMGQKGLVDTKMALAPSTPYGINKLSSELYVRYFAEKSEQIKEYVILRFFGAYGPLEPERKIFTRLIKRFVIEKKSDFTLSGDGTNLIDAMYIDDAVNALKQVILSRRANLTVDLCKGEPMTLTNLVLKVASILSVKNPQVKYSGEPPEPITFFASCEKARNSFGFSAATPLERGIIKFKDYFLRG